jgi:general secretion pathway protein D
LVREPGPIGWGITLARVVLVVGPATFAGCSGELTEGLRYRNTIVSTPMDNVRGMPSRGGPSAGGQIFAGEEDERPTSALYEGTDAFTSAATWVPTTDIDANGDVTLNLVDASIDDAAKAVIGEILKSSYVLDPAVSGTVTIQTGRPVPVSTIVAIFEEALRTRGATLTEAGGFYKITAATTGVSSGIHISTDSKTVGAVPGEQIQVVPLTHVAAAEMAEILKPIASPTAIRRVDSERNLLVLSGNTAELSTILETIKVFDADWLEGKSFGLFKLEHANPADVAKELDEVFSTGNEGVGKGVVKFVPNRSLSSVLVVTSRRKYLDRAATWIRRLDAVGGSVDRRLYIYHIQNRPARELADILQKIYTTGSAAAGEPTVTASVAATPEAAAPQGSAGSTTEPSEASLDTTLQTEGTGVTPEVVDDEPSKDVQAKSDVSIVADETNNSLLIMAKPADYEKVLAILETIDLVPNQVLLEATILEVSLNDQLKFGLRWFFEAGDSRFQFSDLVTGAVVSQFPGFSYFLSATNVRVAVNALSAITDVNVISSPSLMVLDNRKATLQVGDEVPIATQQAIGVVSPDAPIVNSIGFRNTGVLLSVTPRVSDSGRVVLEIEQEVSIAVETTSSGIDSPTIQKRRVRTTVSVKDGESLTLGGLMQERNTLDRSQVPLAGDVPVLGNLFKSKDDRIGRTELLIIITPKVIRDANQASAATEEFRRELDLSLRPAHLGPPGKRENVDRLIVR